MLADHDSDKSRDFICPCGKGYFSYAALFTHVKQKHDGKVLLNLCSPPDRSSSPSPNTRGEDPGRPPSCPHRHSFQPTPRKQAWQGRRKPSLLPIQIR